MLIAIDPQLASDPPTVTRLDQPQLIRPFPKIEDWPPIVS